MLEKLKEEVYRANMVCRNTDWSHLHGEMSAVLTVKKDFLLLNRVE